MNELPAIRTGSDDYPALMALAKELVTTGFLPVAIKTPAQAVAVILTGRELGLPPMQSLRSICIIQGKPELSADLQLSIFHRDGGRSKWLALTATEAKLLLKHPNGDEHTEVFTIEDARRAGLANGQNWLKYPKAMLRSRAITAGLKSIGFEPLTGAYAPGEIGGPEIVEGEPETVSAEPEVAPGQAATSPPPSDTTPTVKVTPRAGTEENPAPKTATATTRAYVLDQLGCQEEGVARNTLHAFLVALAWLNNDRVVEQWPLWSVPTSKDEIEAVKRKMTDFSVKGIAVAPYAPHGTPPAASLQGQPAASVTPPAAPPPAAPSSAGPEPEPALPEPEATAAPGWRDYIMTFGSRTKGKTLGSLPEAEIRNYCENFTVREAVEDDKGVKHVYAPAIVEAQKALRAALDQAATEFAAKKG